MDTPLDGRQNRVLNALGPETLKLFHAHGRVIETPRSHVLCEAGAKLSTVFFPLNGIVSSVILSQEGDSAEVAIIGAEGLVGSQLLFAGGAGAASYTRVVAQFPGMALAVRASVVAREFERNERLRSAVLRFAVGLMHQITQCALCNRVHRAEQRFCRWLLMSADLQGSDSLCITQELMAEMLGMRRETVTLLSTSLERRGIIRHARGQIEVSRRGLLSSLACECYGAMKREYCRLGLLHLAAAPRRGPASRPANTDGV